jgi:hypothetical protein
MDRIVEQTPELSLKSQLGLQFKYLEKDFNEVILKRHIRDLVRMTCSKKFKYTCAHKSWYGCIDQQKTALHFEMHAASKCMDICATLNMPIDGDFAKILLGYHIEYYNIFFVKTKREKIQIDKRIISLINKIKKTQIYVEGWNVKSFLRILKFETMALLSESIFLSLK